MEIAKTYGITLKSYVKKDTHLFFYAPSPPTGLFFYPPIRRVNPARRRQDVDYSQLTKYSYRLMLSDDEMGYSRV